MRPVIHLSAPGFDSAESITTQIARNNGQNYGGRESSSCKRTVLKRTAFAKRFSIFLMNFHKASLVSSHFDHIVHRLMLFSLLKSGQC